MKTRVRVPGDTQRAEPTDGELIAASLTDADRFAGVFDRYWTDVHRYIARRLGSQVAADVAGEVFLEAFRRRDRYDTSRPDARPWLYGIASNLVSGHRRTEQRHLSLLARAAGDDVAEAFEERSDSRVEAVRFRPRLVTMLEQLRPADRDLLLLIAWADLSYEEAAEVLGLRIGTVRSRLSRLRRRVRKALEVSPQTVSEEKTR